MKPNLFILIATLSLAALACNSLVALPGTSLQTGPHQTFSIDESLPAGAPVTEAELSMAAGTATLTLAGGASSLVEGQIEYNVADWQPVLSTEDEVLYIKQGLEDNNMVSVPDEAVNQWDLALGDSLTAVSITCPAGQYTLNLDDSLPDGAQIAIDAGAATLRLVVPAGVTANVEVHRGPSGVETEGDWALNGRTYTTSGSGPTWTISLDIGVGKLTLVAE